MYGMRTRDTITDRHNYISAYKYINDHIMILPAATELGIFNNHGQDDL